MRVVVLQLEILEAEPADLFYRWVQPHLRERPALTAELLARLLEMILVKMQIAESVNELARLKIAHLRHHQREQRIRRDVEGHAKEEVGAALIELAA